MRMRILSALCAVFALTVGIATATAGKGGNAANGKGGNSANAKSCQKGGWQHWLRADQTPFANQGACVSYGAKGGTLTAPRTTSISTYLFRSTPGLSAVYAISGTGFTPNHAITLTVTGFGPFGGLIGVNPLMHPTDANGAFNSGADANGWTGVYLACRDIPETAHVTASDGMHQASTDISFTTCP